MYFLIQQNKNFIYEPAGSGYRFLFINGNFTIYNYQKIKHEKQIIYIVDDHAPSNLYKSFQFRTILICSPRDEYIKKFTKESYKKYFLPIWTTEELIDCVSCLGLNEISNERIIELCKLCGPVPRYIFQNFTKQVIEQELMAAIAKSSLDSLISFSGTQVANDDVSHKIFHIFVEDFNISKIDFASDYIKKIVIQIFKTQLQKKINQCLVETHSNNTINYKNLNSVANGLYEDITINQLITESFSVMNLSDKSKTCNEISFKLNNEMITMNKYDSNKDEDIEKLKVDLMNHRDKNQLFNVFNDRQSLFKMVKGFPVIDAFTIKYDSDEYVIQCFQSTLALSHNMKINNLFNQFIRTLKDIFLSIRIDFYFIVSDKNYPRFKNVEITSSLEAKILPTIQQFCLKCVSCED